MRKKSNPTSLTWKHPKQSIVESGIRVKELRSVRNMTRQQLADEIGLSLDALRKIETGTNEAKIDTLASIADVFMCHWII